MRRAVAAVCVLSFLVALYGCRSAGTAAGPAAQDTVSPSTMPASTVPAGTVVSTTQEPPAVLQVTLAVTDILDVINRTRKFATDAGDSCNVRQDGSRTGFDESGQLTVTDRAGTILGQSALRAGKTSDRQTTTGANPILVAFTCTFTVDVRLYERSKDLSILSFSWPSTGYKIERSVVIGREATVSLTHLEGR